MEGSVLDISTGEIYQWEGKRIDFLWKQHMSSSLVPLFEYRDADGKYTYSTKSKLPSMKRAENPLCYVWKNPSTTLALDYDAKPIAIGK
jgi:hypothetical protein